MPLTLGVVGDVHQSIYPEDIEYFNGSDIDLLLFVGDLAQHTGRGGRRLCKVLGYLQKPTLIIPGNHDSIPFVQRMQVHLAGHPWVSIVGYSQHSLCIDGVPWTLIAARPHSVGGDALRYPEYLQSEFGVASMAASGERLCRLVEESESEHLMFLAHNGPSGLGAEATDIWGCDFRPEGGDYGDEDLRVAIAHAHRLQKHVGLVAAGHMHHRLRSGGQRNWCVQQKGCQYVNAARVPRVWSTEQGFMHHYVRVEINGETVTPKQVEHHLHHPH